MKELVFPRAVIVAVISVLGSIGHSPAIRAQTPAQTTPEPLAFEVASVRPFVFARNQFAFEAPSRESRIQISGTRVSVQGLLSGLLLAAYKLRTFQLTGAPEWRSETGRHQIYVIEAKAPGDRTPTIDEARQMLQTLLAERFQLKFHRETKELPTRSPSAPLHES